MSETANAMANAFEAEAGTAPVVNVSGVDAPTVNTTATNAATPKFYTEEDLARVRSQEKDKLYPEIERLKEQVNSLAKDKEEKAARKAAQAAEEAAEAEAQQKAKLESDLDAKELLKLKEQEWQEQLARERSERETAFALLEREREFANLQNYKQQLLDAEGDNVMPQLLKYLQGNTREELEASLADLKAQSESILTDAQAAIQQQRKEQVGTRATLPPNGPLETNMEQRQLTPQEIAAMPLNEYAKYRDKLLSPAARNQSRGLFG